MTLQLFILVVLKSFSSICLCYVYLCHQPCESQSKVKNQSWAVVKSAEQPQNWADSTACEDAWMRYLILAAVSDPKTKIQVLFLHWEKVMSYFV